MKFALITVSIIGLVFGAFYYQKNSGENPGGKLALCGGSLEFTGESKAARGLEEIAQSLTKAGIRPKLASIQSGASSLKDSQLAWDGEPNDPGYKEIFTSLGFDPFLVPLAVDNKSIQNDPEWIKRVEEADVIFLNGGDQIRHIRSLLTADDAPTPMLIAAKNVLAKGGVVIGTSAGTHASGTMMFGGGTSEGALTSNKTYAMPKGSDTLAVPGDTAEVISSYGIGLGFLQGILLDSHTAARGRVGRLLVALATMKRDGAPGTDIGMGVDENTCLIWDIAARTGNVRGQNSVWILDISGASFSTANERSFTAKNAVLSAASDGDDIIMTQSKAPGERIEVRTKRQAAAQIDDLRTLFPLQLFGRGDASQWVTLKRTANTRISRADDGSVTAHGVLVKIDTPVSQ